MSPLMLPVVGLDAVRATRDQTELLTALLRAPGVEPFYRQPVVRIPADYPEYRWRCVVARCEHAAAENKDMCQAHRARWRLAQAEGVSRHEFASGADPVEQVDFRTAVMCRICRQRPATSIALSLCRAHRHAWLDYARAYQGSADLEAWCAGQRSLGGFGTCAAAVCEDPASNNLGLCGPHELRYHKDGRPGGARPRRSATPDLGRVTVEDSSMFAAWCASTSAVFWPGQVNLRGLPPLLRAQIQWGILAHARRPDHTHWSLRWIQRLVDHCRAHAVDSIDALDPDQFTTLSGVRMIVVEMTAALRVATYTPEDTRAAGFLEFEHFGVRIKYRLGHFDLRAIPQRWLREMAWDHVAARLRSPAGARTSSPLDGIRRACTELGAWLEAFAPAGGHEPGQLRAVDIQRFVADQRRRAAHMLAAVGIRRPDGTLSTVTDNSLRFTFNYARMVLREAMDTGAAENAGLPREFIVALPYGGKAPLRPRRPFSDQVAQALAEEANLVRLAERYDPKDLGIRDAWEVIITTGRRCSEVLELRLECIGRYGQLELLWHDQTKVGNLDEAVRIPARIYALIERWQEKTLARFAYRHGRAPSTRERSRLALFPSNVRNPHGDKALSYGWFSASFKAWVGELDLGSCVTHQARHTLATRLLRHGADLHHIKRFLGHVSTRMAEHYAQISTDQLEDILRHVWVAGPGAAAPGTVLSAGISGMNLAEAKALAIDLSRRATPAEGGFCTFQPVVDGGACPWNLDCQHCDRFVLSGADLLYWRRKREQWHALAERAPDDATADYLHRVFEPTSRAIDGLENALAGLGLLDQAFALDYRRPQDYFQRVWSQAFRARDLAETDHEPAVLAARPHKQEGGA